MYGESAAVVLNPDKGVSAITIKGTDFEPDSVITVCWENLSIPTVPLNVSTDETGAFTCIISVYNQTAAGAYQINIVDSTGTTATATFTVLDVTGPKGDSGQAGTSGTVSPGYIAGLLLLAIVIGAAVGGLMGRRRREESDQHEGTN
jgi:hypothetical protein